MKKTYQVWLTKTVYYEKCFIVEAESESEAQQKAFAVSDEEPFLEAWEYDNEEDTCEGIKEVATTTATPQEA